MLYTRRKLNVQVRWLDVTNTSKLPISTFQASLNTTQQIICLCSESNCCSAWRVVITRLLGTTNTLWTGISGVRAPEEDTDVTPQSIQTASGAIQSIIWCSWSVKVTICWNLLPKWRMIGARILHPLCLRSIPVAARSKAWVCGRLLAGIVGSNPAGGINICLLWVLYVVR
jgi:hypothetical protein